MGDYVEFAALDLAGVTQILTNLAFVALVLERALEVFVTAWRGPGRADVDASLGRIRGEMARVRKLADGATVPGTGLTKEARLLELATERNPHTATLAKYKSDTQVIALRSAVVLGLLTAAVGYRALATVVDASSLGGLQAAGFTLVDVLLTGGLLAGGSKGIHALTQVFGNYLDTMAEGAKGG